MALDPLNGSETHPLTKHAYAALDTLSRGPAPTSTINPGVINRLMREDLMEIVDLPSPYFSHKSRLIKHAQITQAGRDALEERTK